MKQIAILFVTCIFFSCANSMTEVWVNKNTSGKVKMSIDMGEAIDMVGSALQEMDPDNDGQSMDKDRSPMFGEGKIDSTIVMYDMTPDSVLQNMTHPDLLKNMIITMKGDADKEEMILAVEIEYDDEKQLEDLLSELGSLQEGNPNGGGMSREDLEKTFANQLVDYENGIVRIQRSNMMSDMEEQGLLDPKTKAQLDSLQYLGDEVDGLSFLKEMLNTDLKTKYYLPGKVEFTNDPNAIIEGNSVIFTDNIWEALLNGEKIETQDRIVKYTAR